MEEQLLLEGMVGTFTTQDTDNTTYSQATSSL